MNASEAARIFHDWAFREGLMPDGPFAAQTSTVVETAKINPATDAGKQMLRSKQVQGVAFDEPNDEIIVFTKKAAPTNKKQIALLPATIENVKIRYRQGVQNPIGGEPSVPFGGPAYVMRTSGIGQFYACGSSISVGNYREAGTLGCLVRDANNVLYGLSNNHVSGSCSFAGVGLPIVAPGIFDGVPNGLSPFTLGFHANSLPLIAGSVDNVDHKKNLDAAIFKIVDEKLVTSFQQNVYDTPIDVGSLIGGMQVEKVGRTTGHTAGRVLGQVYGAHEIHYNAAVYGFNGMVSFEPVFAIVGQGDLFSDGGDSGSLITTIDATGKRFAVGIVVGGRADSSAPGGKTTIALPIAPILQGLGVTLVTGINV